ncbi:hypothetical protein PQR21_32175 [Paraburkholderia nemoris]|jgi:hypothetical protein|uniref:hypothetical protein n=1 Tax=Paraburkholderia nemoris TaxID=2793076 RepID=UPI000FF3B06F
MQPSEFLYRIKNLPADTPLTATHVAALIEALSPILTKPAPIDLDALPNSKLIDETTLADWLGESVSTLQKWRVSGNGPKFVKNPKSVRYQVGAVRDWIEHNTVQSTSEASVRLSRFGGMSDGLDDPVPAIIINDVPTEFFRSLEADEEPTGYAWVAVAHDEPATFHDALANSLLGQFCYLLEHDCDAAIRLAQTHPELLTGFRPEEWFFGRVYPHVPGSLLPRLQPAFQSFVEQGLDINHTSRIRHGETWISASVAHLLTAVTMTGAGDGQGFSTFLTALLNWGLDVDLPDEEGKTALQVATDFGFEFYPKVVNSYRLREKLGRDLSHKSSGVRDGDKL